MGTSTQPSPHAKGPSSCQPAWSYRMGVTSLVGPRSRLCGRAQPQGVRHRRRRKRAASAVVAQPTTAYTCSHSTRSDHVDGARCGSRGVVVLPPSLSNLLHGCRVGCHQHGCRVGCHHEQAYARARTCGARSRTSCNVVELARARGCKGAVVPRAAFLLCTQAAASAGGAAERVEVKPADVDARARGRAQVG